MPLCRVVVSLFVAIVVHGAGMAQDPGEAPRVQPPGDIPCAIDAQLSSWLALESVDRTIAALETERRELAAGLATQLQALDVLARANDRDGVPLTELTTLVQAKATGRDAIEDAYAQIQNRLIDIDKTLIRRRRHQAMLEAHVEAAIEAVGKANGAESAD